MAQTQYNAVGFGVKKVLSGLEGATGVGFSLGTNLTLELLTVLGTPVARNLPYSISYTDPATGAQVKSILHDPSVPYQEKLPEGVLLSLDIPASALYLALTATFTITPNTQPVWRVRLPFSQAFARVGIKRYF